MRPASQLTCWLVPDSLAKYSSPLGPLIGWANGEILPGKNILLAILSLYLPQCFQRFACKHYKHYNSRTLTLRGYSDDLRDEMSRNSLRFNGAPKSVFKIFYYKLYKLIRYFDSRHRWFHRLETSFYRNQPDKQLHQKWSRLLYWLKSCTFVRVKNFVLLWINVEQKSRRNWFVQIPGKLQDFRHSRSIPRSLRLCRLHNVSSTHGSSDRARLEDQRTEQIYEQIDYGIIGWRLTGRDRRMRGFGFTDQAMLTVAESLSSRLPCWSDIELVWLLVPCGRLLLPRNLPVVPQSLPIVSSFPPPRNTT